jgi:hypothetical protein
MIKSIFTTIAAAMFVWFAQDYFRNTPHVTFSISEPIEIPSSSGLTEFAQEINIANSGRDTVKEISIRVQRHINSYKLTKHTSLLTEVTGSDPKAFELIYPELPVGKKFTLLLRYSQDPIDKKWISISDPAGPAINQDNDTYKFGLTSLWIAFVLGLLSSSFSEVIKFKRMGYARWTDSTIIYRDDKPWYFSINEWSKAQFQVILERLRTYSYSDLSKQECFQLLNRDKPKQLADADWKNLCDEASKLLALSLSKESASYNSIGKLIDLYKIDKPKHLSLELWDKFQEALATEINNKFIPKYVKEEELADLLIRPNIHLQRLPESVKAKVVESAQLQYFRFLMDKAELMDQDRRIGTLQTARLDLLAENQKMQVEKFTMQILRMQGIPEDWSASGIADFVMRGRPIWMRQDEFDSLKKYEEDSAMLQNSIETANSEKERAMAARAEMEAITNQALTQLHVIDE